MYRTFDFSFEIPDHLYIPMRVTQQPMTGNNLFATIFAGSKKKGTVLLH